MTETSPEMTTAATGGHGSAVPPDPKHIDRDAAGAADGQDRNRKASDMSTLTTQLEPPWARTRNAAARAARGLRMRLAPASAGRVETPSADAIAAIHALADQAAHRPAYSPLPSRGPTLRLVTLPILAADLCTLALTGLVAYAAASIFTSISASYALDVAVALVVPILFGNLLTGLYPGICSNPVVEFRQLSRVAAIAFLGVATLAALGHYGIGWYLFFAIAFPLQFALAPIGRLLVRRACRRQPWWGYPVLVFGSGPVAATVVGRLLAEPEYGLRPIAVLSPDACPPDAVHGVPVVGTPRLGATIARRWHIRHAIVAMPDLSRRQSTRVLERYAKGIRHVVVTSAVNPIDADQPLLWRDPRDLAGVAGVEVRNRLLVPTPRLIKRTMDLVLSGVGLLCLLPLLGVIAALVKRSSPGPIFFGHTRIGSGGHRFKAWKFRSMVINGGEILAAHLAADPAAEAEWECDHKLKNDPRVTRIGAFLRRTSLDELPQLWNVLRGDMSLVGPRPIVDEEIAKYGKCYATYKAVRPGISGLWQVSGRNDTTYEQRLQFDEFYVRNWSPWLDMHILARTITAIGGSRGAY